jgi:5,10-methenyltetrahydrofolate synthetase
MPTTPQPAEHHVYTAANRDIDDAALRAALRREKIAARTTLAPAEHARLSALLAGHLERAIIECGAQVLAFCWPIRAEFDARELVVRHLARGGRAVIPTVIGAEAPMVFRGWTPQAQMTVDPFGIPVPADAGPGATPDLVLLPLVAFDAGGYRLGYGGGYFDRTLAAMVPRPLAFGVGFEIARAASVRPQVHDIPLDAVITEAGATSFDRTRDAVKPPAATAAAP